MKLSTLSGYPLKCSRKHHSSLRIGLSIFIKMEIKKIQTRPSHLPPMIVDIYIHLMMLGEKIEKSKC